MNTTPYLTIAKALEIAEPIRVIAINSTDGTPEGMMTIKVYARNRVSIYIGTRFYHCLGPDKVDSLRGVLTGKQYASLGGVFEWLPRRAPIRSLELSRERNKVGPDGWSVPVDNPLLVAYFESGSGPAFYYSPEEAQRGH